MLSRVAESLYWMSRYIERAEDMTRILAVNFQAMLDSASTDIGPGWEALIGITGDAPLFRQYFSECHARTVTEFMLWYPDNANAVTVCLTQARENARSVREQISAEMWEHINRLYFLIKDVNRAGVLRGPLEFFRQMRDGSQAFQGITDATMSHDEPYQFIQLGKYLERADKTVRILDVKYAAINTLPEGSPAAALQLIAMLKSCSAFEPYRKTYGSQLQARRVAEFLLLNRNFPRAVFFCLDYCRQALDAIAAGPRRAGPSWSGTGGLEINERSASSRQAPPGSPAPREAQRSLGRLRAELEYLDIHDVLDERMDPYLNRLLTHLNAINSEITRSYFNTQVILPGRRPQQVQQQQ